MSTDEQTQWDWHWICWLTPVTLTHTYIHTHVFYDLSNAEGRVACWTCVPVLLLELTSTENNEPWTPYAKKCVMLTLKSGTQLRMAGYCGCNTFVAW